MTTTPYENVKHPNHYNQVPGIECIDVIKHFMTCRGNAIKYLWRAGHKNDIVEDLRKAQEYIQFEIDDILEERQKNKENLIDLGDNFLPPLGRRASE